MTGSSVALLVYANIDSTRDALAEEKYKDLAAAFSANGANIRSISYNDDSAGKLTHELLEFDAVLVWVNPIEQGKDRKRLDALLTEISQKGCFVSTHPEVILKMGTKEVLFITKDMDWGGDTTIYSSYEDFTALFRDSLRSSGIRILKQYRGNGGNGVFKIINDPTGKGLILIHAIAGNEERSLSWDEFYKEFKPFFLDNGMLIDQAWNKNTTNGMVRCYLSGTRVAGFGYQEINALYELNKGNAYFPPGKRYYFTENCGLFNDLKEIMENEWVPQLQKKLSIAGNMMPVIWDADFFINDMNNSSAAAKYTLCEINVSCVSPFPPSAINYIVDEVRMRVRK
jgi:hypothetical protein